MELTVRRVVGDAAFVGTSGHIDRYRHVHTTARRVGTKVR
jgi:hypothetical protein